MTADARTVVRHKRDTHVRQTIAKEKAQRKAEKSLPPGALGALMAHGLRNRVLHQSR